MKIDVASFPSAFLQPSLFILLFFGQTFITTKKVTVHQSQTLKIEIKDYICHLQSQNNKRIIRFNEEISRSEDSNIENYKIECFNFNNYKTEVLRNLSD